MEALTINAISKQEVQWLDDGDFAYYTVSYVDGDLFRFSFYSCRLMLNDAVFDRTNNCEKMCGREDKRLESYSLYLICLLAFSL